MHRRSTKRGRLHGAHVACGLVFLCVCMCVCVCQHSEGGEHARKLTVAAGLKNLCRKQLSSAVYRMHRIGVIGCVAVMKEVGRAEIVRVEGEVHRQLRGDNALELFESLWRELLTMFESIQAATTRIGDLFDELAAAIDCGGLHDKIIELIQRSVQRPIQTARCQQTPLGSATLFLNMPLCLPLLVCRVQTRGGVLQSSKLSLFHCRGQRESASCARDGR